MRNSDAATPLSPEDAKRKITLFLKDGRVKPSFHCLRVSMPKRSVGMQDIEHVLGEGEIFRPPEWDEEHGDWKYVVEGTDQEGDKLRAVTVFFDVNMTLYIITVF